MSAAGPAASRPPAWILPGPPDPTDVRLLFLTRAARLYAYGSIAVMIVLYLPGSASAAERSASCSA